MDTILNSFHVELNLFIAQIVNFAIVFAVLYYFVIRPTFKVMGERSARIEESMKEAEANKEKLKKTEEDYAQNLAEARIEAGKILDEASKRAEEKKEKILARTKEEIGVIINKEKESMRAQKDKTMKELKREISDLVILSLEKVIEQKLDSKDSRDLIKKILK